MAASERDRHHETYDYWRYEGRKPEYFEPILARMRPVPPILDVGCGLGLFVECCRRHGLAAVGVELSEEGIRACASRRLPVVRADLGVPFPFRDNSFGSALAHHVLEHTTPEQNARTLREVLRVLRPGGFLFAISPNVHNPRSRDDPDHINLFTPHQLAEDLRAVGFSRVSLATNYWLPFWEPRLHLGRFGNLLSGALWKVAPWDRRAGSASALAWK